MGRAYNVTTYHASHGMDTGYLGQIIMLVFLWHHVKEEVLRAE